MEKFRKAIWMCVILLIVVSGTSVGLASDVKKNEISIAKEPLIQILGQLKFDLPGSVGYFREVQPGKIRVRKGYRYKFSVAPFSYTGDKVKGAYSLEVTYWIDNPKNSFSYKKPLVLSTGKPTDGRSGTGYLEMLLYGGITINQISAQPAGEYQGNLTVTVTGGS